LASIADILVGSFRYCANEEEMDIAGKAMFPKLMGRMWKRYFNDKPVVRDYGFVLRPQEVQKATYKKEYDALRAPAKLFGCETIGRMLRGNRQVVQLLPVICSRSSEKLLNGHVIHEMLRGRAKIAFWMRHSEDFR
jgi:hypothetical protein